MGDTIRKIRTIVIDDEYPARKLLADYVSKVENFELVAECESAVDAMNVIQSGDIDLIFSDIQMPELTGIDLVKSLNGNNAMVVFTTAYSEYAIESYELNAVDYLLKPISLPRFMQTVAKVTERFKILESAKTASETQIESGVGQDYIMIKADHKLYRVEYREIMFVEGQSEYVTFHLNGKQNVTAYYSLKKLALELPSDFIRIHKSYIVSVKYIDAVEGVMLAVAGRRLPIGKLYKEELIAKLYNRPVSGENISEEEEEA